MYLILSQSKLQFLLKEKMAAFLWNGSKKLELSSKFKTRNPVKELVDATKHAANVSQESDPRKGVVLIFYGSPYSSKFFPMNNKEISF